MMVRVPVGLPLSLRVCVLRKVPGMRTTAFTLMELLVVDAIIALRCLIHSGRLEDYWEFRVG